MATLKNLVDETTNIKNELVTCHSNLKNNLVEKGVECSNADKMPTLINKIKELGLVASSQSGVTTLSGGVSKKNINISKVDLSKSICYSRRYTSQSLNAYQAETLCVFNSDTSIQLKKHDTSDTSSQTYWEVIEFESGVKSVFNILLTLTGFGITTYTHNLNYENPAKCVAFYSYNSGAGTTTPSSVSVFNLQSNSFDYSVMAGGATAKQLNVFIVEFL